MSDLPPMTEKEIDLAAFDNLLFDLEIEVDGKRRADIIAGLRARLLDCAAYVALNAVDDLRLSAKAPPVSRSVEYILLGRHRK
jgi:hypothetical protein